MSSQRSPLKILPLKMPSQLMRCWIHLSQTNLRRRSAAMLCKAIQRRHSLTWRRALLRCIETLSSLQLKSWLAWDGSLVLQISHRHFILVTRSTGSLYAEQPAEGLPNAERGQLLRLRKTCYGLTDGPYAWFKHIVNFICNELGYRQSVVDPCLSFLDSPADSNGHSHDRGNDCWIRAVWHLQDLFHAWYSFDMPCWWKRFQPTARSWLKFTWREGRTCQQTSQSSSVFDPVKSGSGQFYTEASSIKLFRSQSR